MSWSKEKISDFAQVITGGTPSTDKREYWDGGNIPWLNSGDLNQGVITKASNFITEAGYKNSSTKLLPPDTVLIALTGATTGLSAILKIGACANQSVTGIFPSDKHHPEFLYYFFRTQRQRILDAAWGGAQPHINQKYVKDYVVPLPPLKDQFKIASVLSKAEALIKQRTENIDLIDEFLKSTFLKMFGDPVRNEKAWEKIRFSDAAKNENSKRVPVKQSERHKREGPYPYYGATGIIDTIDDFKFDGKYLLIAEDGKNLLFRRKNNAFRAQGRFWVNNHAHVLSDNGVCNLIYLEFFLNAIDLKPYISGIDQVKLNKESLESIPVPKPPIDLQNQFAEIVEKAESLKEQFKNNLKDLEDLFSSLSQRAFKGELDLSGLAIDHIIPISKGGNTSFGNIQVIRDIENIKKADKYPEELKVAKHANDAFQVDEEAARNKEKEFDDGAKTQHTPKTKSKLSWDKVSTEQAANWIKERYKGYHFNSEMLIRFMMEEYVTIPDYFSSEELKKYPRTNEADDFKSFVSAAVVKENPFVHFEQLFYNGEIENFQLRLTEEDYLLIKDKTPKERSGIYFKISE